MRPRRDGVRRFMGAGFFDDVREFGNQGDAAAGVSCRLVCVVRVPPMQSRRAAKTES